MSISYQILYWRDIPSQVKVRNGRQRVSRSLAARFQEAIDEAAMRARATSEDAYMDDWRQSDWKKAEGEAEQFADQLVSEIETAYPAERLAQLKASKGKE